MEYVLKTKDLKKTYGNYNALNGLSMNVPKGSIYGLIGRNGVGKTTLIQCCMGFLKWKEGGSYLQDKAILSMDSKELFSKIGFIPQAKNFNVALSVFDMVLLGCNAKIDFNPKKEHCLRVEKILQEVGIIHLKDKTCDALSGGELQMVIFARALVNDPLVVVLDEPESHLDFHNQHKILEILKLLKHRGKGIIINTHYPQNAQMLADKVLIMHKNQEYLLGDNRLLTKKQLARSFEVEVGFFDYLAMAM